MSGQAIGITVLLLLVCGAFAEGIADRKGRSGSGWFVIGFLLGPLGVLLAMTGGAAPRARPAAPSEGMKKCPFCAELIKAEAIKCRYCQSEMPTAIIPRAAPTPPGTVVCRSCGRDIRHDPGGACPHCGFRQPQTSTGRAFVPRVGESASPISPAFLRAVAVALLLFVALLGVLTIAQDRDEPEAKPPAKARAAQPAPEKRGRRR